MAAEQGPIRGIHCSVLTISMSCAPNATLPHRIGATTVAAATLFLTAYHPLVSTSSTHYPFDVVEHFLFLFLSSSSVDFKIVHLNRLTCLSGTSIPNPGLPRTVTGPEQVKPGSGGGSSLRFSNIAGGYSPFRSNSPAQVPSAKKQKDSAFPV